MIDYHGANRFYQLERLGGVNVNVQESQQRFAQHSLFDIQNKYTNIKSELASSYVRELIASSIGVYPTSDFGMIETLKEMFTLFFPGKTFSGPRALETGTLSFPIEIEGGAEHDIDDLSSGEKELVYGYLRLRNSSPKHSILLLDEPELYLNPRLIRGLPDFYKRHLGVALNNQIWLVTHSDAFLREAVGRQGFSVFHMTPPTAVDRTQNQAMTLSAGSELEKTILAMVGDLASYRPGAKIVIFEGDTGTEFDISLVSRLFPSIVENLTPLSGSNRRAVVRLYEMLKAAITAANLPMRIYAIVDRDTTPIEEPVYPLDAGKKWA